MTRRLCCLLAFGLLLVTSGCVPGSGGSQLSGSDLPDLAKATALSERGFTASSTFGGSTVLVEGRVSDDYRYSARVSLDGKLVYQEVVIDDHRWLRLHAPEAIAPRTVLDDLAALGDPNWAALLAGGWVVDPAGAPPEFSAGVDALDVPLTAELVLSRVRFFDRAADTHELNLREYNQKAIYYLPKDDKFELHREAGTRFDHVPRAFDPNGVFTDLESAEPFFEYVSVWADTGGWNRYETLMELPDPSDETFEALYTQLGRAGSRRLMDLIRSGPTGRRFAEVWTFEPLAQGVEVVPAPPDGAVPVDLTAALRLLAPRIASAPRTPLYATPL